MIPKPLYHRFDLLGPQALVFAVVNRDVGLAPHAVFGAPRPRYLGLYVGQRRLQSQPVGDSGGGAVAVPALYLAVSGGLEGRRAVFGHDSQQRGQACAPLTQGRLQPTGLPVTASRSTWSVMMLSVPNAFRWSTAAASLTV